MLLVANGKGNTQSASTNNGESALNGMMGTHSMSKSSITIEVQK